MWTIAVTTPCAEVVGRSGRPLHRQLAERGEQLLGDARRLLVRDRIGQRHRVRDLGRVGEPRRRHVEREEPAREAGVARRVEIDVHRRLAAPAVQHEVVVPVDDHCRILRTTVAGSAVVTETPLRIIICEDDEKLATLVEEILDADGRFIVVGRAGNGDEAVRLVAELAPDVVLMDIGMPVPRRHRRDARDPRSATRASTSSSTPARTSTATSRAPTRRAPPASCTRTR